MTIKKLEGKKRTKKRVLGTKKKVAGKIHVEDTSWSSLKEEGGAGSPR